MSYCNGAQETLFLQPRMLILTPFRATSLSPPTTGKFLEELIKKWSLVRAQSSTINHAIKISAEAGCHLLWPDAIKDLCKKVNTLSINIDEVETCTHLR